MKVNYFTVDKLQCYQYENRTEMGIAAAKDIANMIRTLLKEKEEITMMFAAAPSQNDVLASLVNEPDIDWTRITGCHMDEYIGLPADASQGFGNFLKRSIFELKPFRQVYYINPTADNAEEEASRYEQVLLDHPVDICVLGIGENGHIAFNDPEVADFKDQKLVKPVKLDQICRQQQVNDGCFETIDQVPATALTVTVPGMMRAKACFCIVPAKTKAKAIKRLVSGTIAEDCPCTILRRQDSAKLYIDKDSASLLNL